MSKSRNNLKELTGSSLLIQSLLVQPASSPPMMSGLKTGFFYAGKRVVPYRLSANRGSILRDFDYGKKFFLRGVSSRKIGLDRSRGKKFFLLILIELLRRNGL